MSIGKVFLWVFKYKTICNTSSRWWVYRLSDCNKTKKSRTTSAFVGDGIRILFDEQKEREQNLQRGSKIRMKIQCKKPVVNNFAGLLGRAIQYSIFFFLKAMLHNCFQKDESKRKVNDFVFSVSKQFSEKVHQLIFYEICITYVKYSQYFNAIKTQE